MKRVKIQLSWKVLCESFRGWPEQNGERILDRGGDPSRSFLQGIKSNVIRRNINKKIVVYGFR